MSNLPLAILFDADGTLYDSSPLHFEAYRLVAKELYDFDFSWELFRAEILHGTKKAPEVLRDQGLDVEDEHFYVHKRAAYEKLAAERLRPLPGLLTFLRWCKHQGIRCYVVSASTRASLDLSLSTLGIADYFEGIVGHEDVGEDRKPHPLPYIRGLEKAAVLPAQTIAIEDAANGVTSAKAAGIRCVGILNATNDASHLAEADHIIDHYNQFKRYLLSL